MTQETLSDYLAVEKLKGTPSKTAVKRLSGKVWPTGEFSFGTYADRPDETLDNRDPDFHWDDAPAPLNLTNLPNSRIPPQCPLSAGAEGTQKEKKTRGKYGKKGITGYGKKMLKSGGYVLGEMPQKYRLTFCTITLPPLPQEVRRAVSEGWGNMVNRLLEFLSRRLRKQGLAKAVLCATEVQPGRLKETSEAYLHLHLVWPNHRSRRKGWAIAPNDLRGWLVSYLETHYSLDEIGHVNVNTQAVKKSACNYLAKYVSKGSEDVQAVIEDLGEEALPGQWWSMTKTLKERVWLAMDVGEKTGERLHEWLNYAWNYDDFTLFRYIYHVEVPINGVLVTVGWRGCLTPEALGLWKEMRGDLAAPLAE
jgi:hypothetical protein